MKGRKMKMRKEQEERIEAEKVDKRGKLSGKGGKRGKDNRRKGKRCEEKRRKCRHRER